MILKRLVLFLSIALLATSCFQYKKPEKPENLISKDKMVSFLIDVKLVSSTEFSDMKIVEEHGVNPNNYVFEKHNIDSLQFALSHDYYVYYSKEYEEIYARVVDSLENLKAFYKAVELKEKN